MIEGHCRTNLDGYEMEQWPTQFVAVPRVGERVAAESGRNLKVVEVTHRMNKPLRDGTPRPCISVELHR